MKELSECDFLDKSLIYYTYYDFCRRRKKIKESYKGLTYNQKKFYLWYVYANLHMSESYKNYIWDYLNDNETDEHLLKLQRWYKAR